MLTRLKDGIHWAKALSFFEKQDFDKSQASLMSIKGERKNASEYFALLATVKLALGLDNEAIALFRKAEHDSTPTQPSYQEYISYYCKYYSSLISGNAGESQRSLQDAIKLDAPNIIRRWLPLS